MSGKLQVSPLITGDKFLPHLFKRATGAAVLRVLCTTRNPLGLLPHSLKPKTRQASFQFRMQLRDYLLQNPLM